MANSEHLLEIGLAGGALGFFLSELLLPKYDKASNNATNAAVSAIIGFIGSIATFGFTNNIEASFAVGSTLVGAAANRGLKWLGGGH